ncbi:MAG: PAS domain S-box protein [Alphaproteobacteria bacterium]|nr:PAS domain S-box protein [Alphaproteobacteria bacterium]
MPVMDQLEISDKDFRNLFLKAPIARMVINVEPGGRFTYAEVNDAAAAYFDIARDKMLGRTPAELFEPAVAEQIEQSFSSCVKTRRQVTFNALPRFPGGIRVQAFILNPIFEPDGRTLRYIDIMARPDVVDSVQLQRERDDAIMLLTSLFDASGLGIVVTDHHGRIVRVNDSFLAEYEWTREDLLGEEFAILIPPEDQPISRKLHKAFIERGRHGTRELQILKKDGTVADIHITTALLELSQRRRFMVSTIRDVTERKNMMRNLRRAKEDADGANKAKSAFLANMSHELRTPLNAIIGFSELMKNQTFGPINNPKYEEYLSDIHFSARHLLDIINDVLDMSKIEAGKVNLVESEVDVGDVMESVARIMSDRADAANVTLDVDPGRHMPAIRADQRLLRQILINLVANAVKFSPAGKTVSVKARMMKPGNHLRISVADEGCGIPHDKIRYVLEPFGQVNDPKYYTGQGTGLGLPLAKAMVELHEGKLTLESDEGKGTRVYLDFPAARTLAPH